MQNKKILIFISVFLFLILANFFALAETAKGKPDLSKISLDIKGMDILDVLKILANQSGLNIVAGRNVTGRITIFLKDVDVMDAFEIILASNDLAYEKKGDIINVMTERDYELKYGEKYHAKKDVKAITLRYAKASEMSKALGQVKTPLGKVITDDTSNTIIIIDVPAMARLMEDMVYQLDVPTLTEDYTFKYANVADIKDNFKDLLTSNIGILKVDERMNKIIVTDTPQVVKEVIEMAKSYDDKTPQVFLDCQIIQITLSDEYKLGIDWESAVFAGANLAAVASIYSATSGFSGTTVPYFKVAQNTVTGDQNIRALVKALATFGTVRTLSNPKILALNNQEAKVLVGTRQPYVTTTTSSSESATTYSDTVTYLDLGTNLTITPTINPNDYVKLSIKPEISASSSSLNVYHPNQDNPNTIPIVTTTELESTVMVKDGQTVILGGLIKDSETVDESKIPLIGDIPLVGAFFRSRHKKIEKTETVVIITPKIIKIDEESSDIKETVTEDFTQQEYHRLLSQRISEKIKDIGGMNAVGSVKVIFTLFDSGQLEGEPVARTKDRNLRDVAIAAVKIAAPFPPFPKEMPKEREEFNILISFE